MKRLLVRAILVTLVVAVIEALCARLLATRDPVSAMIGGDRAILLLFPPLYAARLFLYLVAPPWLVVRAVLLISRRASSRSP